MRGPLSVLLALTLAGCGASLTEGTTTASTSPVTEQRVGINASKPAAPQGDGSGVTALDGTAKQATAVPPAAAKALRTAGKSGGQQPLDQLLAPATPGSDGYIIGSQDVLEISVFKVPELSKLTQVSEAGTIGFPLVGNVKAAGRTAQQVEADLAKALGGKYLQSPQVTVMIKEYNSQRATVEGAVKKPGVYPLRGKTTLMQVLAMSEGVDTATASSTVVVFRQEGGKKSAARFDLDELRNGSQKDPDIRAGDLVIVDTSSGKAVLNNVLKLMPLATVFALL